MSKIRNLKDVKLAFLPFPLFLVLMAILLLTHFTDTFKVNLYTGLTICAVMGCLMRFFVDNVPIIQKTLGASFVALACAFLVYFGLIPEDWCKAAGKFINGDIDFLNCFVMTIICGSILSMDRDMLIKAGIRYFIPVTCGLLAVYGAAAAIGPVLGITPKEAILNIAGPIMGGGNGAGVVPMSQIYSEVSGKAVKDIYPHIHAMATLGNWISIGAAILLNLLGNAVPSTTGNGRLMKQQSVVSENVDYSEFKFEPTDFLVGICIAGGVFLGGRIVAKFFPAIHSFGYSMILVALVKILNLFPKKWEYSSYVLYRFVSTKCMLIFTAGIGLSMWNLAVLFKVLTLNNLLVCGITVLGAIVGAWIGGIIVGFYPIESSITAGLCMSNLGGNGDIYVLSCANRMELMPFAQISSRIGGAIVLALQSILAGLWLR